MAGDGRFDVDAVVIGAGAAGLAAGRRLGELGLTYRVLEARDRIGGRAWTDTATIPGVAWDHGCHWLHNARDNPLRLLADEYGLAYDADYSFEGYLSAYRDGAELAPEALGTLRDSFDAMFDLTRAAGLRGEDRPIAEIVDHDDPAYHTFANVIGLITGVGPDEASTLDFVLAGEEGGDYPVIRGLGSLIARHGRDVAVELSSPVEQIDWSGKGVVVSGARGTVRARAAVVTVPTDILADDKRLKFTPDLPERIRQAANDCPLGRGEKVAFLFDGPIGTEAGQTLRALTPGGDPAKSLSFHMDLEGKPSLVAHVGGPGADPIIHEGADAMIAYARDGLVDVFGSEILQRVVKQAATGWTADPYIGGCYSAARPGRCSARRAFQEPIGDRIFLAGEATALEWYASAHGANRSGIAAVDAFAKTVRHQA